MKCNIMFNLVKLVGYCLIIFICIVVLVVKVINICVYFVVIFRIKLSSFVLDVIKIKMFFIIFKLCLVINVIR